MPRTQSKTAKRPKDGKHLVVPPELHAAIDAARGHTPIKYFVPELLWYALRRKRLIPTDQPAA